jgi:large subunit ribosomal protein L1
MGGRRTKVISGTKEEKEKPQKKVKKSVKKVTAKKAKQEKGVKKVGKEKKARGKKYLEAKKRIDPGKSYPLTDAIKLVKETSLAKFDSSVEVHINLGLDLEKQGHGVRTNASLPHGTGKDVRVLVFAEGKAAKDALAAGADEVGDEDTIDKISKSGKAAFEATVSTPSFMSKLAKIARILGPKGLMPSPKTGTIGEDPAKIVSELKKGRAELRTEAQPIIHTVIGKVSFPDKNLIENLEAVLEALNKAKPGGIKGDYIKSLYLKATMGPSVKVALDSLE